MIKIKEKIIEEVKKKIIEEVKKKLAVDIKERLDRSNRDAEYALKKLILATFGDPKDKDGTFEEFWYGILFKKTSIIYKVVDNIVTQKMKHILLDMVDDYFKEHIYKEEFIDNIVERIKRKQLKWTD